MRKTFALLAASSALTVALGVPAFSALHDAQAGNARPDVALAEDGARGAPLILASGDDDDDDDGWRAASRHGHDDDDDDDDDDDCDDDDRDCRSHRLLAA